MSVPVNPYNGRFPFPPFPAGWYALGRSSTLARGSVLPCHVLGKELVWYRGESGLIHVTDAFCPHLGAHIGHGGRVVGDDVVCPFHGWRFDSSGQNVDIPYRPEVNRAASLAVHAVRELAGLVFIWHHPEGWAPAWELPAIEELSSSEHVLYQADEARWHFRSHPQEILENAVDVAHFQFVHLVTGLGSLTLECRGPMLRATAEVSFVTPRGEVAGAVESELWGLGLDIVRHRGLGPAACVLMTVTPVDGEHLDVCYQFVLPRGDEPGGITRYGNGLIRDVMKQITQDIPIWEHKVYRDPPRLARGEEAIMEYRRWARQFYAGEATHVAHAHNTAVSGGPMLGPQVETGSSPGSAVPAGGDAAGGGG